jgi:hypothetical protein
MSLEERVIEDSEEDYEHFSDSDSSQGLNHSEYLRLAREQMKDELRQRHSKGQSEHTTYESSIPNSNGICHFGPGFLLMLQWINWL